MSYRNPVLLMPFIRYLYLPLIFLQAKELAREYMKKSELQLQTAEEKVGSMEESFEPFKGTIDWKNPWWIELIHDFESTTVPGREEGLITRVKQELSTQLHTCTIMGSRCVWLPLSRVVDGIIVIELNEANGQD